MTDEEVKLWDENVVDGKSCSVGRTAWSRHIRHERSDGDTPYGKYRYSIPVLVQIASRSRGKSPKRDKSRPVRSGSQVRKTKKNS
jgi:hypothetical protein